MSISLPDIDPAKIATLDEAREAMHLLMNSFEDLVKLYVKQEAKIAQLETENRKLKGQPKKPHFQSSAIKHPTSKSVRNLLKEKGVWHKRSKKNKLAIDQEQNLAVVTRCDDCGGKEFRVMRTRTKLVQGIVIQRKNVLYRGRDTQCTGCGKVFRTSLPKSVFDQKLKTFLSFGRFFCRMTQPLLSRLLTGFEIQMSSGEIDAILLQNSMKLKPAYQILKTEGFAQSPYLGSDATGSKRKEKRNGRISNQYMQIIGNKLLSVFSITRHYNSKTLNRLLGKTGRIKSFVGDDGSPNGECLKCKYKQVCWVHEIRHYKKIFPFFTPHQELKIHILRQWQQFYHLAKHYAEAPPEKQAKQRIMIEALFDEITTQVTNCKELDSQLGLTRHKKDRLLTFLDHPELPIHNNQCELDLREFVIQRNISHETKSVAGDRSIERHLSVIQTAQKQGLDIFSTLHGLLTGALSPTILTTNIR
jgi:hypothetical protein